MRSLLFLSPLIACLTAAPIPDALRPHVTLHASFDRSADADSARGERRIHHAPGYKEQEQSQAKPGIGDVDAVIEQGAGVAGGGALRFRTKNTRALFFPGDRNVSLQGGTLSFWLRLHPEQDLAPGYSDPIQVTDKAYNDSAIWVDFTKDDLPRHFRLGVFGSLKEWNPSDTPPDKNPDFLRRLIVVEKHPFTRETWTHVAVTWSGLGERGGSASLFVNGKQVGAARRINEKFAWNPARLAVRLGVGYTGFMDEVALFDRVLSADQIASLHRSATR